MTIKFMYLDTKYAGRATIAYDTQHDETSGTLLFTAGVAYCGPRDHFNKVTGRNKARGRLVQMMSSPDGEGFALKDPDKYIYLLDEDGHTPEDLLSAAKQMVEHFLPAALC